MMKKILCLALVLTVCAALPAAAAPKNPEAAIAFAEFLAGPEAQKIATLVGGSITANKSVYEDPVVQKNYAILNDIAKAADDAKPRPQVRDYSAVSAIIQVWIHKALTG